MRIGSTKGHAGAQPALGCAAPALHSAPHLLQAIHFTRLQAVVGTGQAQRAVGCVAVLGMLGKLFVGGGGTDRKFNRMRPSMARVLGLETRSAKEG